MSRVTFHVSRRRIALPAAVLYFNFGGVFWLSVEFLCFAIDYTKVKPRLGAG